MCYCAFGGTAGGVIHFELLKPGEKVTVLLYSQQVDRIRNELLVKRSVLINQKGVALQHKNPRPNAIRLTLKKIRQLNWEV